MGNIGHIISANIREIFVKRKRFESNRRLDGQVVVITGANTGIGKETAFQLSLRGAKIYICCRNLTKADEAIEDILTKNSKANITSLKLDLSSLKSIRLFAEEMAKLEQNIDILINNAGVFMTPEWKTEDGFEMQFGTNHLGPFLLTLSLMPLLKKSVKARVVNVASGAYMFGKIHFENINLVNDAYSPMKAYSQSKLGNILFTRELAKRLGENSTITTYCLHPGSVNTEAQRHITSPFKDWFISKMFINPEMGCQTTLYCAVDESLENESGFYYDNCKRSENMLSTATDDKTGERLWDVSCDLVHLDDKLRRLFVVTPAWQNDK